MHTKTQHKFNAEIIREYDIRGIYGNNLTNQDAYFLGIALSNYLTVLGLKKVVSVGRDGRKSSAELLTHLINGLINSGCDVIDLGITPTSAVNYYCHSSESSAAGIMITASHNPENWNGFKIFVQKNSVFGQELLKLCGLTHYAEGFTKGKYTFAQIIKNYTNYVADPKKHGYNYINTTPEIKILWDACNGAAAKAISILVNHLPGQHIVINNFINGDFAEHPADPSHSKTILYIKKKITSYRCDFAFVFDGDGDRLLVVDKNFNIFYGDSLLCIFAVDLGNRIYKPTVIADIKISETCVNEIKKNNLNLIITKTGYPFIKQKMKQENAMLAGEVSGHIFFQENYFGFDDAIFAACKLTYLIQEKKILKFIEHIPTTFLASEIKLPCSAQNKELFLTKLKNILKLHKIKYLSIDGIRCKTTFGWWIIRASNTENLIFIRYGSTTHHYFNFIFIYLSFILQKIGIECLEKTKLLSQHEKSDI